MGIRLIRKNIYFRPDSSRVLARYFNINDERKVKVIKRVLSLTKSETDIALNQLLRNFSSRHRSVVDIWERNFKRCMESPLGDEILNYS